MTTNPYEGDTYVKRLGDLIAQHLETEPAEVQARYVADPEFRREYVRTTLRKVDTATTTTTTDSFNPLFD